MALSFHEFTNLEQAILAGLAGRVVFVRVPYGLQHRTRLWRDILYREARLRLRDLEDAVQLWKRDEIRFRSGGRMLFVADSREACDWREQDWAVGIDWYGGLYVRETTTGA